MSILNQRIKVIITSLFSSSDVSSLFNTFKTLQLSPLTNRTIGENVLEQHDLPNGDYWYWIGVGALFAYALLFNCIVTLSLMYLNRKLERYLCA